MTSSSARRVVLALALAALAPFAPATAAAQAAPSASDLETARALVKEGREKRAAGDLPGALAAFRAAHALGQTPVTGLELARAHEQLGELLEAREVALSIGRTSVASDETERSVIARRDATALAESLRPRIPTLYVRITGALQPELVEVTVDGALLAPAARGQPRKVNPGKHAVAAALPGAERVERSVELAESETREVVLEVTPAAELTAPVVLVAPAPLSPPEPPRDKRVSPILTIGIVLAGGGIAVGSVTGISALNTASDLSALCPGNACPPQHHDVLDGARTMGTVSTVGFAFAAVGAVMIVYGLATSRSPARSVGLRAAP